MNILSLDFGGITGWAIGGKIVLQSGSWDIRPLRGESPGMRYVRLRSKLNEIHAAFPDLSLLAHEQAHHRGGAATEQAAGCVATMQAWCAEKSLQHVPIHSQTVKKFICGTGRADKNAVVTAIKSRGFSPSTHDEADAIAILLLAAERYGG